MAILEYCNTISPLVVRIGVTLEQYFLRLIVLALYTHEVFGRLHSV